MRICAASDFHGYHNRVTIPDCDLFLFAGDLTNCGEPRLIEDFNLWLGKLKCKSIIIAGNHDLTLDKITGSSYIYGQAFFTNATYLNNSMTEFDGLKIWGSPMSKRVGHWAFQYDWYNGESVWQAIPEEHIDIIMTHGPPAGILDELWSSGERVGCQDLHKAIRQKKPVLHLFGHIHEAYGQYVSGPTTYINAAIWDHIEGRLNKPFLFDIDLDTKEIIFV